jgi:hypothetical protein
LTVTARVASFESSVPSLTVIATVELLGPSGNLQSNEPPLAEVTSESAT